MTEFATANPGTTLLIAFGVVMLLRKFVVEAFGFWPNVIRARAEAACEHEWTEVRSGPLVENMGEEDERRVGSYALFRCDKCGAERQY